MDRQKLRAEPDQPHAHVEYQGSGDLRPVAEDHPVEDEVQVADDVHAQVAQPEQQRPRVDEAQRVAYQHQLVVQLLDGLLRAENVHVIRQLVNVEQDHSSA